MKCNTCRYRHTMSYSSSVCNSCFNSNKYSEEEERDSLIAVHRTIHIPVSQWDEPLVKCEACGNEAFPIELERQGKQQGDTMHTQEMQKIQTAIRVLKGLIKDYEDNWEQHAHGCSFYLDNDDSASCLHDDPSCDPVCEPGNCPLTK